MKRKKIKRSFSMAVILLLSVCVWLFRTEKPSALPKQDGNTLYENAWIVSVKNDKLIFMSDGVLREVPAYGISEMNPTLADIEMSEGKITRIGVKSDTIRGKVLAIGPDFIEIEGYGRLPLSKKFAAYQLYGELRQTDYHSILVGYDTQEFIVGNGQICGAVMTEEVDTGVIRVLLRGDSYESDSHERIAVRSSETIVVEYGEEKKKLEPGVELLLEPDSPELSGGRVRLYPETQTSDGRITVTSLQRAQGNPSYYGSLEISSDGKCLTVINEVNLEQYLYDVVPSEMPASYGLEALKAQAVCARSYACRHILANSLSERGAHVDDSSNYQVYNNYPAAELSNQAVDETRGQIMMYEGEIVQAYYFSTSCGYTTNADIWADGYTLPYISGRRIWKESEETDFQTVITDWDYPGYDSAFPWYRWYVNIPMERLEQCILAEGWTDSVGKIQGMEVSMRGKNGIVKEIAITGEKGSVIIEKELQIRKFLSPVGLELHRKDGEILTDFTMLPSAFFLMREILEGEQVTGYRIEGGGFGHGVGMSQNAAKVMAEEGMSYLDILKFFYQGVEIQSSGEVLGR